jgi:hypothetical protein
MLILTQFFQISHAPWTQEESKKLPSIVDRVGVGKYVCMRLCMCVYIDFIYRLIDGWIWQMRRAISVGVGG